MAVKREIAAFVIAPLAAPIPRAVIGPYNNTFGSSMSSDMDWETKLSLYIRLFPLSYEQLAIFGLPGAYLFTLLLGLPIYIVLRRFNFASYRYLLVFGVLIALLVGVRLEPRFYLIYIITGALMASVFQIVRGAYRLPTDSNPGAGSKYVLLLAVLALVAAIPIAYNPGDTSCHNTVRGGDGIAPVVRMDLHATNITGEELFAFYQRFAETHQLRIRGHAILTDSGQANMCNSGVTISAGGLFGTRHSIGVYVVEKGSDWKGLTKSLICALEERWPSGLSFTDGGSRVVPMPVELRSSCER